MMNLYGGQGMGTSGTGISPGGGVDLQQIIAMLQRSGAGAPPGGMSSGASIPPGPMSGYIGAPTGPGMHPPMMPPVAANPPPAAMPQMGAGSQTNPLMQMLAQMKGGQTGVAPTGAPGQPAALPDAQNPMQGASPGWLQMILQHMQGAPQVPQTGAGGMT